MRLLLAVIGAIVTFIVLAALYLSVCAIGVLLVFPFMAVFILGWMTFCAWVAGFGKKGEARDRLGRLLLGVGIIALFWMLVSWALPNDSGIAGFVGVILSAAWAYVQW